MTSSENGSPPHNQFKKNRRDSILAGSIFVDPNYLPKSLRGLRNSESELGNGDSGVDLSKDNAHVDTKVHTLESSCPGLEIDGNLFSRVLVLYTGGTIGMKNVNGALAPIPNYMGSVVRKLPMFHDQEFAESLGIADDVNQPFIMPEWKDKTAKRIIYSILEYDPVLDSSNMTMTDWARLARDIKKHYDHYDGFVVLHGTDTMGYTASALSFMIDNLGKPVIVTGSQIPLFELRSDGLPNFLGALIVAGQYCIPEVCVCFNNKIMRGNRTIKIDSGGLDAFHSPNLPPLAEMEIDIHVNWSAVFKSGALKKMQVHTNFCPHVGLLRFFPSITKVTIAQFLQPPMKGVILQTYGAGNGPDSQKELLNLFQEATDRGVLIVNITQCSRGRVSALYAAGKALLEVGVLPGSDMTPEAALTKLAYVLGRDDWPLEEKRMMLAKNLRGEMKVMEEETSESSKLIDIPLLTKMKDCMNISSQEEMQLLRDNVYPPLICSAAREGNIEALDKLLEAGGEITSWDYDGRTPLHVASSEGHLETVQYLLKHGALLHIRDRYGSSALNDAIRFDQHHIIEVLMETGAHLMMHPQKLGIELCLASAKGDVKKLQSYSLAGGNLSQGDYDKRTALHVAVSHGHVECVNYLLSRECSAETPDSSGKSPIDEALRHKKEDIYNMLIKQSNKNNNNENVKFFLRKDSSNISNSDNTIYE